MEAGRARAARPGDAGSHHADRVDAPRLRHRREVGHGRRRGRQRGAGSACIAAARRFIRFDMAAASERTRQRHQRGVVRCAVRRRARCRSAASLRSHDPAAAVSVSRRACGAFDEGARLAVAPPPPVGPRRRRACRRTPPSRACPPGRQRAAGSACATPFPSPARARWLSRRRAPPDRLPGPGLRRAVPGPHGAHRRGGPRRADGRDGAPPGAVDELRGHDARGRPEDARQPLRARAQRSQGRRRAAARHQRIPASAAAGDLRHAAGRAGSLAARARARRGAWSSASRSSGRIIKTSSLRGYLLLYAMAGLRRWRRGSLRYSVENARIEAWLAQIHAALPRSPRWHWKSRAASAWSRATATRTSAARATSSS